MSSSLKRLLKLRALIADITLLADEGMLRHTDEAYTTFASISRDAEQVRRLVIQLQKETSQ